MEDEPRRHRITVDEYRRMGESGLFAPDARVELIEGEIIDMPPIGPPHAAAVNRLTVLLIHAVGERAIVQCQQAIQLGDISEPQPDFSLILPREDYYEHQRPVAADTLLAIEVSDTTLRYDLNRKMALYARHGIKEYWVVDTVNRRLHVFCSPTDAGYEHASFIEKPGAMQIAALPGTSVDLSSLFRAG